MVADMGFHTMLTEGAKHILGWKSPNYMYCNNINPKLKVLLRNFRLSDDLTFRFSNQDWSEWPLTTEKFVKWLNNVEKKEEVVNLFLDYETIGEHQWKETGIFDFFRHLPAMVYSKSNFSFNTPEQLYHELQPVSAISVPHPISWADEERDLTAWLGNELQDEAFGKLYSYEPKVRNCTNPEILKDWLYLQTSNHFYYMCTKWFSAGEVHKYFNPYGSPYEAFINYMNVLSDFMIRVDEGCGTPVKTKVQTEKAAKKATAVKSDPGKTVKKETKNETKKETLPAKVVRKRK
jgi:alpha-amylase